jgi:hypothetical protein
MGNRDWRVHEENKLEALRRQGMTAKQISALLPCRSERAVEGKLHHIPIEDPARVERMVELAFRGMA